MCNLYSLNKGQDHLRQFFKVTRDETGNMPPLPGIVPDTMAPVICQRSGARIMLNADRPDSSALLNNTPGVIRGRESPAEAGPSVQRALWPYVRHQSRNVANISHFH
jgi:putative SOS response-associated peptidase YedK